MQKKLHSHIKWNILRIVCVQRWVRLKCQVKCKNYRYNTSQIRMPNQLDHKFSGKPHFHVTCVPCLPFLSLSLSLHSISLTILTLDPLTNRTIITTCLIKYACILCGIKQVHQPHPHQLHLFVYAFCCWWCWFSFFISFSPPESIVHTKWCNCILYALYAYEIFIAVCVCVCLGRHKLHTKLNIISQI